MTDDCVVVAASRDAELGDLPDIDIVRLARTVAKTLENAVLPQPADIVEAVEAMF